MKKIKSLKFWLWPLGLVVFVVALIAGAIIWLGTPSGSRTLLGWVQTKLERDFATQLTFDEGRIALFSGISFKNLRITRQSADGPEADVQIESFDLAYRILPLKRQVEISQIRILKPKIRARLKDSPLPQETAAEPTDENSDPLAALESLVREPPVELKLERFELVDLGVDFEQSGPWGVRTLQVPDLDVSLSIEMKRDRLMASGFFKQELSNGQKGITVFNDATTGEPGQQLIAGLTAAASGKWDLDIHRDGDTWLYTIKPLDLEARIDKLAVWLSGPVGTTQLKLDETKISNKVQVEARTAKLFKLDADAFRKIEVSNAVDLTSLRFISHDPQPSSVRDAFAKELLKRGPVRSEHATPAKTKAGAAASTTAPRLDVALSSLSTDLAAKLSETIRLSLDLRAKGIASDAHLHRPLDVEFKSAGEIPRDLRSAAFKGDLALAGLRLLGFDIKAEASQPLKSAGSLDFIVQQELARVIKPLEPLKKTGSIEGRVTFDAAIDPTAESKATLSVELPKLKAPPLTKPVAFALTGDVAFVHPDSSVAFKSDMTIKGPEFGDWRIEPDIQATLPKAPAEKTSAQTQPPTSADGLRSKGSTRITQLTASKKIPARLEKSMSVTHAIDMTPGNESVQVSGEVPSVLVTAMGRATGTRFRFSARAPKLSDARDVEIKAELDQKDLILEKKTVESIPALRGMRGKLEAHVSASGPFTLDTLSFSLERPWVRVSAQGNGHTLQKTAAIRSQVELKLPPNFTPLPGQTLQGGMSIPTALTVLDGRELTLEGHVDLKNLAWSKDEMGASGMTGRLPFSERLRWDGEKIRFSNLITQNPFERVDFERVRPLLQSAEQFRIDELRWQEKTFGPFIGFFSVRQNMLFAHQFDLDIGSGRMFGQMFFNAHPANLQLGLLSRLTGLNVKETLPKKFLTRVPAGDARLSGRSGFVLSLNKAALNGRIDVTEIGGAQLIALINVLDPLYEDDKMNKVRSLLQIGYPTGVELAFADGYMNMDVSLSALGIAQRQSLRGIPVSSLLSTATAEIVKTAEKGPLK